MPAVAGSDGSGLAPMQAATRPRGCRRRGDCPTFVSGRPPTARRHAFAVSSCESRPTRARRCRGAPARIDLRGRGGREPGHEHGDPERQGAAGHDRGPPAGDRRVTAADRAHVALRRPQEGHPVLPDPRQERSLDPDPVRGLLRAADARRGDLLRADRFGPLRQRGAVRDSAGPRVVREGDPPKPGGNQLERAEPDGRAGHADHPRIHPQPADAGDARGAAAAPSVVQQRQHRLFLALRPGEADREVSPLLEAARRRRDRGRLGDHVGRASRLSTPISPSPSPRPS